MPDDVSLVSMPTDEAQSFLAVEFDHLVDDLAEAHGWSKAAAVERATEMDARVLPHGELTDGHLFLWVLGDSAQVGRLWLGPMLDRPTTLYIWSISIEPSERGRGLGEATIAEVVRYARATECGQVALTVWDSNPRARRLYERLGFRAESNEEGRTLMVLDLD